MTSPQKQPKAPSRWGFLQQAVASVESRLDTILGDEIEEQPNKPAPALAGATRQNAQTSKRPSVEASRSGTSTPNNDRLQARLAQAMTKKGSSRPESPMPESAIRSETPKGGSTSNSQGTGPDPDPANEVAEHDTGGSKDLTGGPTLKVTGPRSVVAEQPTSTEATDTEKPRIFLKAVADNAGHDSESVSLRTSTDGLNESRRSSLARPSAELESKTDGQLLQLQLENEEARQQLQEEISHCIARIDTLQNNLEYFKQEALKAIVDARKVAEDGSVEQKMLEKEAKYASLMEESQKLSETNGKYWNTIKKLNVQAKSREKELDALRSRTEKVDRSCRQMEEKASKAELATKRAEQNLASSLSATNDYDALAKERDALNATLADIKARLSRANARAEAAESRANSEQLEKERKKNAELQDDLTSVRVERELSEEKLRREVKDLRASIEREKEHARTMESEMLGEQAALESKLESFRARVEEASSSDHGDVQAKLLRQVETLQSQYAAASQNWQGIESSLLARITNVERERDEVASRESDVRRKLRELTIKAKRMGKELEEAHNRLSDVEKAQFDAEEEAQRSSRKARELEAELAKARREFEQQKTQADRDMQRRLDEEKAKWAASLSVQTHRNESPVASVRKGSGLGLDMHDRSSRRASILPTHDYGTPNRQQSLVSIKGLSNGAVPETPSLVTSGDPDEYFANVPPTPASQSHPASPRAVNDLISTSTVGAGPSVQLVERMSANVRRLESEKAASKDEIGRLTTQRDESRQEVVSLMREVEQKRKIEERLETLEQEHRALEKRHQTTLEMLGEKSERVEELKADIVDVKAMYRQLADTMK